MTTHCFYWSRHFIYPLSLERIGQTLTARKQTSSTCLSRGLLAKTEPKLHFEEVFGSRAKQSPPKTAASISVVNTMHIRRGPGMQHGSAETWQRSRAARKADSRGSEASGKGTTAERAVTHLVLPHIRGMRLHCIHCEGPIPGTSSQTLTETQGWADPSCQASRLQGTGQASQMGLLALN